MTFIEPRNDNGVRELVTPSTDTVFKNLHRNFGRASYATDIDLIDYRFEPDGSIRYAAVWELKQAAVRGPNTSEQVRMRIDEYYRKRAQVAVSCNVAQRLRAPVYLIVYTLDCSWFYVHEIKQEYAKTGDLTPKRFMTFDRQGIQDFIDGL